MEVALTLDPLPDFLRETAVQEMFAVLGEGNALIVGGAVRKAIQGGVIDDIDVATKLTPQQVADKLGPAGFQIIPTGLAHGTVTAVKAGHSFEITTLRADVETDGRHAIVRHIDDWLEDAKRRDFTFNSLLLNGRGEVFDPLGCGLADLESGAVYFVGDAATRIREDYLRSFRFYRFWAVSGAEDFVPDFVTAKALAETQEGIAKLSRERVTKEMFKLLSANRPKSVVSALLHMKDTNLLPRMSESAPYLETLLQLLNHGEDVMLTTRLVALYGEHVDYAANGPYLLSGKQLKEISSVKSALNDVREPSDFKVKKASYLYGVPAVIAALQIKNRLADYAWLADYTPPQFPLRAANIQAVTAIEGKALGDMLRQIENDWVESGFNNNALKPYL